MAAIEYSECPGGRSVWQCAAGADRPFTVTKGAAVFANAGQSADIGRMRMVWQRLI